MADFNALHALINAYIKKNGVKAITGQILNGVLSGMVNALGKGYTIAGVATPTTDPGTMTGPCAYYASQAGTYTNFGGLVVNDGDVAMLIYDEQTWHKEVMFSLSAEASVDANVGTPWVNASFENGMLTFTFGNLKGNPGDAAGFGTVNATVDSNIGTPGVSVQTSGPDTAKNMTFQFTNLKGETGVTSVVVTVDNTSGNPACAVSLNGQELHLDFTGLKGAQGDTGVSADYPIAIVNNLTTSDPTSALSAQMGVQLESEISQLELKVDEVDYKFGGDVTFNETKIIPTWQSGQISKTDGSILATTTWEYTIITLGTAKVVRFLGNIYNNPNSWNGGYAFYDENDVCLKSYAFDASGDGTNRTKEYIVNVPEGAYYFKTSAYTGTTYPTLVSKTAFYCFLRSGETVTELFNQRDAEFRSKVIPSYVSKYNGSYVNLYIGNSDGLWKDTGRCRSVILNIEKEQGNKIRFTRDVQNVYFAFLTTYDYTTPPTEGSSAAFVPGTSVYSMNNEVNPKELTVDIPQGAKFLYIKLREASSFYNPSSIEIINVKRREVIPQFYAENYETFIEENIHEFQGSPIGVPDNRVKVYKIESGVEYRIVLAHFAPQDSSYVSVTYLDVDRNVIGTDYAGTETETLYEMELLSIPSGCEYIMLKYPILDANESSIVQGGLGAIMRPLLNDGRMPLNLSNYCVSKIKVPVIPNGYDVEDTTFPQTEIWSAWAFMLPYDVTDSYVRGNKHPICSYFHGSSSYCSTEYIGGHKYDIYYSNFIGQIRNTGCIVFDINGYGISYKPDNKARHWGCPAAVATAKKAYEILVNCFNGRRGMVLSGWSMGGSLAKSYAMTYPQDVIACALEAPSELGAACRYQNPLAHSYQSADSEADAWGYTDRNAMWNDHEHGPLIGYSPCIKPLVVGSDGGVKKMAVDDFVTESSITSNLNNFIGAFPVEVQVWQGDADEQVPYYFGQLFVNTVRNAGGNAKLRTCPNCLHDLSKYAWVKDEIVNYIKDKLSL